MKMPNFTRTDLIKAVADVTGVSRADAESVIAATLATIRTEAISGKAVTIQGFGRFAVTERAARTGRNPSNGDAIEIPAARILKFRAAKASKS